MTWTTPSPTSIPYAEDGDPRALWPSTSEAIADRLHELLTPLYANGTRIGGSVAAAPADVSWASFGGDPFGLVGDTIVYNGATRMFLITLQVAIGGTSSLLTSMAGLGTASGAYDRQSVLSTGPGQSGTTEHAHHVSMLTLMGPDNVTSIVAGVSASISGGAPVPYDARIDIVGV